MAELQLNRDEYAELDYQICKASELLQLLQTGATIQTKVVAEGEDKYYLKEDDGASKVTNMPFIYNTLKPIFTRHTCQLQISSITESIDD
ncbi:hypothetical protein AVEN_73647-1 [Araneus ventricosus]|uniref:Uncharacterized protein n=1 Tax=Araneus ventricosus TaxID=182803 RepID=A0A4Y2HR34_ARAVE|nr:hypothetical protein AVEN_73647-1 [Araneus ventricosus]